MSSDLGRKVEMADFEVAAESSNFCHCGSRTCLLPQAFVRLNLSLPPASWSRDGPPAASDGFPVSTVFGMMGRIGALKSGRHGSSNSRWRVTKGGPKFSGRSGG